MIQTYTKNIRHFVHFSKVLTGIQPTGSLHLGNYLGAITGMLSLQNSANFNQFYLSIVDMHSLTTMISHQHSYVTYNSQIGINTKQMAKILLGIGINPQKITLFVQSHVKQHSELCWIFASLCPQHWLNTMIQYRQKKNEESSVGLYIYPILMAADIMLYRANYVPVGEDQLQHLQLAKKISDRFNKVFQTQYFPQIKYVKAKNSRVMSLIHPDKKMSKSDPNQRSRINLSDSPQIVKDKIRRAVTDSNGNHITYDQQNRPGLSNLIQIYSALKDQTLEQSIKQIQGFKVSQLKERLTYQINNKLGIIQKKISSISDQQIKKILKQGSQKASFEAQKNLKEIKNIIKLYQQ